MLEHNEEKDKLINEIRELRRKGLKVTTEQEKEKIRRLIITKENELLRLEFGGDRNLGRFNEF